MADYYCVEIANAVTTTPTKLESSEIGAKARLSKFSYVMPTATVLVGETIMIAVMPKGAQVHAIYMVWEALAGSSITIGDSGDADRLVATYSVNAAGQAWLTMRNDVASAEPTTMPVIGTGYEYTAMTAINITCEAVALAAGKYIRGFILWSYPT